MKGTVKYIPSIIAMIIGLTIIIYAKANQVDVAEPPNFEKISERNGYLVMEDVGERISFIKIDSITSLTYWYPGRHPERRPWAAIDIQVGPASYRIDFKEDQDAKAVSKILFGEEE